MRDMDFLHNLGRALRQDTAGATGIEYGLIASLVAMAAMTGIDTLGEGVQAKFAQVDSKVAAAGD